VDTEVHNRDPIRTPSDGPRNLINSERRSKDKILRISTEVDIFQEFVPDIDGKVSLFQ